MPVKSIIFYIGFALLALGAPLGHMAARGEWTAASALWLAVVAVAVFALTAADIAGRRRAANGRRRGADPLTGLLIPSELESEMSAYFRKKSHSDYCLVCMDILFFRRFNTMFGAAKGDVLLTVIGQVLNDNFMFATRVNADIFMFVAPATGRQTEQADDLLRNVVRTQLGTQYVHMVSFKFGVYPLLSGTFSFREAYDGAQTAMKAAKSLPKQREVVYDLDMLKGDRMNKFIEANMIKSLGDGEFKMYIQPKFRVDDVSCCGGEALIRWKSEKMGFLSPMQFVPLFERNGFIAEMDYFMLKSILDFQQSKLLAGEELKVISVNQSRVTISFPNFLERLTALLEQYTVPRRFIEIEFTESAVTEDYEAVVSLAGELRDMGLAVAMDDFGTGYSSLNTLRELPVDVLKLDKEFLRESDTSARGRSIIKSIINMAGELDIETVCEGVETGMQLDFLKDAGCDMVQGYFLSKPMPADEYARRFAGVRSFAGDAPVLRGG